MIVNGIILATFMVVAQVQCEPTSFGKDDKSLYKFVQKHASQKYFSNPRKANENDFKIRGAEPKKIWMMLRHATRSVKRFELPILKGLETVRDNIVKNFEKEKKVPFSKNGWDQLKAWTLDSSIDRSKSEDKVKMITSTGKAEMEAIAENYKKRFASLLNGPVNKIHMLHSVEERTEDSMRLFFNKILGANAVDGVDGKPDSESVKIVEAYRIHSEAVGGVKPNPELAKFILMDKYKSMVARIVKNYRLTVSGDEQQKLISNIFDMCRYEEAWYANNSVWCSFFTKDDIEVLQYAVDLYNFYEWGYGNEGNKEVQCPTIVDMVNRLETDKEPVTAYFTHIPEVSLHLVAMNAYPEHKPLTAANYKDQSKRVWLSSKLVPFAANFAAVLYTNDEVKFFMNEELIKINGCHNGVCKKADLQRVFGHCFPK